MSNLFVSNLLFMRVFRNSNRIPTSDQTRLFSTSLQARKSKSSKSSSSSRYMARQLRDPFVRARQANSSSGADSESYLSRSAFKLIQLDDKFNFINPKLKKKEREQDSQETKVVCELGAAPGGWTQVLVQRTSRNRAKDSGEPSIKKEKTGRGVDASAERGVFENQETSPAKVRNKVKTLIFALDILPMRPILGAEILTGDFLEATTSRELKRRIQEVQKELNREERDDEPSKAARALLKPSDGATETEELPVGTIIGSSSKERLVDVVLSDMMSNTSSSSISNITSSLDLCSSALRFALENLKVKKSSTFVCKFFEAPESTDFKKVELDPRFEDVKCFKPKGSRQESSEMYWVCRGFKGYKDVSLL